MFEVVLKLVDFDAGLLLIVRLHVNVFVILLQLLVILRVVLFELSLLLLELDASLSELLSQILHINCLNAEVARHGQISRVNRG